MHAYTPVPNIVLDSLMNHFSLAETRVFFLILRKTLGWHDAVTNTRKERDWISVSQFVKHTQLSRSSIWRAVTSLSQREYIVITDHNGNELKTNRERHGKSRLYYQISPLVQLCNQRGSIVKPNRLHLETIQKKPLLKKHLQKKTESNFGNLGNYL